MIFEHIVSVLIKIPFLFKPFERNLQFWHTFAKCVFFAPFSEHIYAILSQFFSSNFDLYEQTK
jgi:hypothetical protein